MKQVSLPFLIIIIIFSNQTGKAVELKPTPIQSRFLSNLTYASINEIHSLNVSYSQVSDEKDFQTKRRKNVSVSKAILYSALIPGLGEYYVGHRNKAKLFFAAEALTWISYFSFRTYGAWKKDDLVRFASERAGANLENKNDEFLDFVGFYTDIDQYNSLGRVSDPERPFLHDSPENHWRWQSDEAQNSYRDLKNRSREAYRRADFMIGAAVVSRILSIIDAVRDAKRAQRKLDDSFSQNKGVKYRIAIEPFNRYRQLSFTLYTRF